MAETTSSTWRLQQKPWSWTVRLAFNGRDHFEYLAAATEIVVVDQGRSPDPPAANRA